MKTNSAPIKSRLIVHNSLAIPSLGHGCEMWTLKQIYIKRVKTAEMKFMGCTVAYKLLDHRRNADISEVLKVVISRKDN
jgi:hypothetical protein